MQAELQLVLVERLHFREKCRQLPLLRQQLVQAERQLVLVERHQVQADSQLVLVQRQLVLVE